LLFEACDACTLLDKNLQLDGESGFNFFRQRKWFQCFRKSFLRGLASLLVPVIEKCTDVLMHCGCVSARLDGMVGSDQCEELIKTLVELISSTTSASDELARQRPIGGDLQSVRQQQDVVQVRFWI